MPGFDLVTQRWIPVLTTAGAQLRGLADAFAPEVIAVASDDDLEDTALTRLLLAVQIAAGRSDTEPRQWLTAHRDHFDLLDEHRPFWQNSDMARFTHHQGAARPLTAASYRHAGSWSTAVNVRHNGCGQTFDLAAAARLLVVRQQFSVGGIQPFIAAAYGKAPMSAKTAVATNRPFVWLDTGRLAGSLAMTASLSTAHPAGTFWFTWPHDRSPADPGTPTGILDALTWPARSILLRAAPGGEHAEAIMICDGLRWPQPRKTDPDFYPPEREHQLIPYTIYARRTATGPYSAQSVHPDRAVWRQLASWCVDDTNPAAAWQDLAAAHRGRWRLGGLGSYQAAIYGPISGSFAAPADRDALAQFLDDLSSTYQQIGSATAALGHAISSGGGYRPAIPTHTGLEAIAAPIASDLVAGHIDAHTARTILTTAARTLQQRAYTAVSRIRPLAAGQVAARRTNHPDATGRETTR